MMEEQGGLNELHQVFSNIYLGQGIRIEKQNDTCEIQCR